MKTFVVMEIYFNGEGDSERPDRVFFDYLKAESYVVKKNSASTSSYDSSYYFEEVECEV